MAASIKRIKQHDGRSDCEMYEDSPLVDEKKRAAMDSHCEIERRRRNKMVSLVNELSDIVPTCNSYDKRKPDKLTILKLAVDHLRSLKVSNDTQDGFNENKSSFLTDSELKKLVLEATAGFLFVVICATGKVIYASDTITDVLGTSKNEWDDVNLYGIVHPEDRSLLRKQLKVEDHELQQPCNNLSQGAVGSETNFHEGLANDLCRRSFIVKMKTGVEGKQREERVVVEGDGGTKYVVVHVTGYIRHWPGGSDQYPEPCLSNQSCLIAIGQCKQRSACDDAETILSKPTSFISRHKSSGVFTFVDSRVTKILGYKPVDLLQRSVFEFCHEKDRYLIEEAFQQVVQKKDQAVNVSFRFFNSSGVFIPLRLSCSAFLNPFSEAIEYISSTYTMFAQFCNLPPFDDLDFDTMQNKQGGAPRPKNQSIFPKQLPTDCSNYSVPFSSLIEPNSCNQQNQSKHLTSSSSSSSHSFGMVSTQNSLPVYNDQLQWVDQQIGNKNMDRTSLIAPPDYHQHLNMFPLGPESDNYHHMDASIGNHAYHWTSGVQESTNQIRMNEPERFIDAGRFMNNNSSAQQNVSWNSFETQGGSDLPYDCMWNSTDLMLNNNNTDVSEMINLLAGASPSTSAMFGNLNESLVKKF